jgi:hypothetical protein
MRSKGSNASDGSGNGGRDVQSVFDDRKKKRPTPRATQLSLFVPSAKTQGIGMLDFYPTIMRVGSGIQMGGRYGM